MAASEGCPHPQLEGRGKRQSREAGLGQCPAWVRHVTPGEHRSRHEWRVCTCGCVYVLAEVYGRVGQSLPGAPLCGERTGVKRRTYQIWANLTLWRPMRKKNVKPTLPGNTLSKAVGGGLNLIHLTNKDNPGCSGKATPTPTPWVQWLSRREAELPLRQLVAGWGGGCQVPSPREGGAASRVGWLRGGGSSSWSPFSPPPARERTQIPVLGGRAGSPNPGGMPRYTRREQGSLQRAADGVRRERYSNTKATVNTTPWGRVGAREEVKTKPGPGPGLPVPWGCGASFGQLNESLLSSWRNGRWGVGRGRAGRGWDPEGADRGSGKGGYTYHSFLEMKDPSF